MNLRFRRWGLSVLICVVLAGCATIMNGDMVLVPVETTPSPAKLTVNGVDYSSPATIQVPRGKGDFVLHVEKEGYKPVDITLRQSSDGWLWGNILIGGLIGLAIDFMTGDAYDVDPEMVRVSLEESGISYNKSKRLQIVLVDIAQLKPEQQEAIRENSKKISFLVGFLFGLVPFYMVIGINHFLTLKRDNVKEYSVLTKCPKR